MGSGEEKRVRVRAFLAFLRYSSASFILSTFACPSSTRTRLLVRLAPVVLLLTAGKGAVVATDGAGADADGREALGVPNGFLRAFAPLLPPPGFGPNKASRFASALRL